MRNLGEWNRYLKEFYSNNEMRSPWKAAFCLLCAAPKTNVREVKTDNNEGHSHQLGCSSSANAFCTIPLALVGWLPLLGLGDGHSSALSWRTAGRAKVAWRWRDMLVHRESPLTKLLSTYLTWQLIMCCVLRNFLGFFLTRYVSKCGCFPQWVTLCLGLPDHLCMCFHLSWCLHQRLHES